MEEQSLQEQQKVIEIERLSYQQIKFIFCIIEKNLPFGFERK